MTETSSNRRRRTQSYLRCRNCVLRRIKCDGHRPACKNCTNSRRVCGGYSVWELPLNLHGATSSPSSPQPLRLERGSATPLLQSIRVDGSISDNDVRCGFENFQHLCCSRWAQRGYPVVWASACVDAAVREPAIFYAAAAAGIAEQSLVHSVHTTLARPIDESRRELSLHLYSNAIACLKDYMHKMIKKKGPLEYIILTCTLFLVYEVISGNYMNGMLHARTGISILNERLHSHENQSILSGSRAVDCTTPSSTSSSNTADKNFTLISGYYRHVGSFDSLEEARSSLEVLIDLGHTIREQLLGTARRIIRKRYPNLDGAEQFCLSHTHSRTMRIEGGLQAAVEGAIQGFAEWNQKFDHMSRSSQFFSSELLFLRVRFLYARFTIATCRASSEATTDAFAEDFARILDIIERLLRRNPVIGTNSGKDTLRGPVVNELLSKLTLIDRRCLTATCGAEQHFIREHAGNPSRERPGNRGVGVFEFGILPSLFTIACRCRTSKVRRHAAQLLLEAERTKGVNSSEVLARYAAAIISLEESWAKQVMETSLEGGGFYADEVPEQARFLDVVASSNQDTSAQFILTCTRQGARLGEIELLRYNCSGGACHLICSEVVAVETTNL